MVWVIAQNKRHKLAKRQGTHRKRTGPAVVSGKRTRSAGQRAVATTEKRHMTTTRDFTRRQNSNPDGSEEKCRRL